MVSGAECAKTSLVAYGPPHPQTVLNIQVHVIAILSKKRIWAAPLVCTTLVQYVCYPSAQSSTGTRIWNLII